MPRLDRRGFSLVELMVALILLVLVGGSMYNLLITVQRVTGKQAEVAKVQGNLRAGAQLVQSELQEIATNSTLATPTSDIISMSATAVQYRAARGIGESCGTPTLTSVNVRKSNYNGLQEPSTKHLLYILWDKDTLKTSDDEWASAAVTAVNTSATCADGQPAWGLTLGSNLAATATVTIADLESVANTPTAGAGAIPIRMYETMEMGLVADGGSNWLGMRSVSSGTEPSLIPVIGPLAATDPVTFTYWPKDVSLGETSTRSSVTSIRVRLLGVGTRNVNTKMDGTIGAVQDSLIVRAQLRNSQ